MNRNFFYITYFLIVFFLQTQVFARCAICYTQGMSGASIAVIVIVTSFIFLFIANRLLQKFLNKS